MVIHLLVSLLLSANGTGKTLVRQQQGTVVPVSGSPLLASFPFSIPGCYPSGSALGTRGQTITVSRTGTRTCNVAASGASAQIVTCQANEACVEANGLLVEPARTNYVTLSGSSCRAGNVAESGWTVQGGCTSDTAADPSGTSSMDTFTSSGVNNSIYTTGVLPTTTGPVTISAWVAAVSGNTIQSLVMYANGASVSGPCTCVRSDGGSCTIAGVPSTIPYVYATVGTTPVRLSLTCSGAATTQTSWNFSFHDGQYGSASGIGGRMWGAQIESGAYATAYVPTSGAAAARNADAISITNPLAGLNPETWCIDGTYTPESGRAWASGAAVTNGWSIGTAGTLNSIETEFGADPILYLGSNDGTANRFRTLTHGYAAGSTHRIQYTLTGFDVDNATMLSDLVPRAMGTSGIGSGVYGSLSSTLKIGDGTGGTQFGGYIRDFKVSKGVCR